MTHRLGTYDLSMLVLSLVIGVGIFRTPQIVAEQAGSLPVFIAAWVLGALCSACGALTFARIGTLLPTSGGYYSIFSACYHPGFAFAMNWSLVVINAGSMAGVALIGAEYLMPVIFPSSPGMQANGHRQTLIAVIIIAMLYVTNIKGLQWGSLTQNIVSSLKILLILALCVSVAFIPGAPSTNILPSSASLPVAAASTAPWWSSLGVALISVFFTYGGYHMTINIGADVREPRTTFPRGIILGMLLVMIVYGSANAAYVHTVGFDAMRTTPLIGAAPAMALFGETGLRITGVVIAVSVIGFLNSGLLTTPLIMTAMAEDGMLPRYFSRKETGERARSRSLSVFAILIIIMLFGLGTFGKLMSYVMFTDSISLACGAACVFILSNKTKDGITSTVTAKSWNIIPLVFIAIMLVVTLNVVRTEPANAALGSVVFAMGAAVYLFRKRLVIKGHKV